jgi:hypothetical protein
MASFVKDPAAVLDYRVDWSDWLETGDTIESSMWTVSPGLTQTFVTFDGTSATVWLAGGSAGSDYQLTNRIVTTDGRTDERTFRVQVRQR